MFRLPGLIVKLTANVQQDGISAPSSQLRNIAINQLRIRLASA